MDSHDDKSTFSDVPLGGVTTVVFLVNAKLIVFSEIKEIICRKNIQINDVSYVYNIWI